MLLNCVHQDDRHDGQCHHHRAGQKLLVLFLVGRAAAELDLDARINGERRQLVAQLGNNIGDEEVRINVRVD